MSGVRKGGWRRRSRFARLWGRWWASETGNVAAELGMAAGFLLILLSAVMEFGMFLFQLIELDSAVAAGAAYAMIHGSSSTGITGAVQSATVLGGNVCVGSLSGSACSSSSSNPQVLCYCATSSGLGAAVTCGSQCSNGFRAGKYVQLTGQYNIVTMVLTRSYMGSFLPNPAGKSGIVRIGQ